MHKKIFLLLAFGLAGISGYACSDAVDYNAQAKKAAAQTPNNGNAEAGVPTPNPAAQKPSEPSAEVIPVTPAPADLPASTPAPAPSPAPAPMTDPTPPTTVKLPIEKSKGCTALLDLTEGDNTVMINGKAWKYVVRKPANYSRDKVWPLVLALHPNGSTSGYWDATSGDRNIRKLLSDKAVIIIPNAFSKDWRDDLLGEKDFVDAIITKAKESLCLDTKRIFSMGFSGGGSYSGYLGCNRTDIRAFAAGGAVEYFDPKGCVGKPATWITIGDDEAVDGRKAFLAFWKTRNACKDESKVLSPATCVAYSCPSVQTPVNFCSHAGGHEWPAFGIQSAWEFFSQF